MIDNAYREFLASGTAFEEKTSLFDSIREKREAAATVWRGLGLPTRREERWKYTDLSSLKTTAWSAVEPLDAKSLPLRSAFPEIEGDKCVEVTLLNGRVVPSWSSLNCAGIKVTSAADADSKQTLAIAEQIEKLIAKKSETEAKVFDALNVSFLNDVVFIEVEAGSILKFPIVINHFSLTSDSLSDLPVITPRVLIKLGAKAQASVIENSFGDGRYLTVGATDIELAQGARLTHARINRESASATRIGQVRIEQARDSFCETFQFSMSGRLVRENLTIKLNEPGAEAILDGLYVVGAKNHVDHFTTVEHVAHHTTSSQLYKGILDGEGRAVFNGRVRIHRDAQQSNAAQLNNNLLLSSKAEIDTKPELEIDADDVKAAHGATIGQIDPEHVFYLQARAIPKDKAIAMLSRGFAADIAFRISDFSVRKIVSSIIDEQLLVLAKGGQ